MSTKKAKILSKDEVLNALLSAKLPKELKESLQATVKELYQENEDLHAFMEAECREFIKLQEDFQIFRNTFLELPPTPEALIANRQDVMNTLYSKLASLAHHAKEVGKQYGKKTEKPQRKVPKNNAKKQPDTDSLAEFLLHELEHLDVETTDTELKEKAREFDKLYKKGSITKEQWESAKAQLAKIREEKALTKGANKLKEAITLHKQQENGAFRAGGEHQKSNPKPQPEKTPTPQEKEKYQATLQFKQYYGDLTPEYINTYEFKGQDADLRAESSRLFKDCSLGFKFFTSQNDVSKLLEDGEHKLKVSSAEAAYAYLNLSEQSLQELVTGHDIVYPMLPERMVCPICGKLTEVKLAGANWVRTHSLKAQFKEIKELIIAIEPWLECQECHKQFKYSVLMADEPVFQPAMQQARYPEFLKNALFGNPENSNSFNVAPTTQEGEDPTNIEVPSEFEDETTERDTSCAKSDSSSCTSSFADVHRDAILVGEGSYITSALLDQIHLSQLNTSFITPADFDYESEAARPLYSHSGYTIGYCVSLLDYNTLWNVSANRTNRKHEISNGTFFPMFYSISRMLFYPIAERIIKVGLLSHMVLLCDESPFINTEGKQQPDGNSQQWVIVLNPGPLEEDRSCYYAYAPHKRIEDLIEFFNSNYSEFEVLLTDGLPGYKNVADSLGKKHALCLAHVRREFVDRMTTSQYLKKLYDKFLEKGGYRGFAVALDEYYKDKTSDKDRRDALILLIVHHINAVFALEREVSVYDLDYTQKILQVRQEKSKLHFDQIKKLLTPLLSLVCNYNPTSDTYSSKQDQDFGPAAKFYYENWDRIICFLSDPAISPTNAASELAIKDAVARLRPVKEKFTTIKGEQSLWSVMSVARSCERNGVNFMHYSVWVFRELIKRYKVAYPTKKLTALSEQLKRFDTLSPADQERLKDNIKVENGIKVAVIDLYDPLYEGPFDKLDLSGLSIIDYKLKCLNSAKLTRQEAAEIMKKIEERGRGPKGTAQNAAPTLQDKN